MSAIDYNDRVFCAVSNTENGDAGEGTMFHYHQESGVVWATYGGGGIWFGTLIAVPDEEGALDLRYQHVNHKGELMTGTGRSVPEILPDGRVRLHEEWQWTSGDLSSGASVIEEVGVR